MARKSLQKGCLQWHGGQWTLLYRLKDSSGVMVQKREMTAFAQFTNKKQKKDAREFADTFMLSINQLNNDPNRPKLKGLTFEQFVKGRWASYMAKRKLERSTIIGYESYISKHLLPAFGSKSLRELTPGDMTDFFDRLGLSDQSALNIYGLLNMMFDVALDHELIVAKPLRKTLHRPEVERVEKPTLSAEMIRNILASLSNDHRLFVAVLATLSIRAGEALALRWLNWDSENRTLSLTHSVWQRKLKPKLKTKKSKRRFVVPEKLARALDDFRKQSRFNKETDYIFANKVGEPYHPENIRRRVLYPLMDKLGIRRGHRTHGMHIFRHTAATQLHELTGDIEQAQKALGHARRATTEDYYDHAENVVAEATTQLLVDMFLNECDLVSEAVN